jgi:hypothetical protein
LILTEGCSKSSLPALIDKERLMTPDRLRHYKQVVARHDRLLAAHPDGARLSLVRLGTHRPDGTLHENYGGPSMSDNERAAFHEAQVEAARELTAWFARAEHRDFELKPLDASEVRARDHLLATIGEDGGGDPVGALIFAHAALWSVHNPV